MEVSKLKAPLLVLFGDGSEIFLNEEEDVLILIHESSGFMVEVVSHFDLDS